MPKPYSSEFRDDVVRVAQNREPGVTIEQIAKDFGVHPMTLTKWLHRAKVEDGSAPGQTRTEAAEIRELRRRNRLLEQENEVLRRAAAYCRRRTCREETPPLVTELAAAGVPVTVTCRVLKLSRQPYYRWLADPITASEVVEAYRANALFDAHKDDPEFGHRLLADEACDAGEPMSDRTAWRIASVNGWFSAFGKPKRGKHRKPGPPVHDDLCVVVDEDGQTRHVFAADAPNELWLTDITEHKVYPVVFIDALVVKVRDGQVRNKPFYLAVGVT